jgi:hypothetical protein
VKISIPEVDMAVANHIEDEIDKILKLEEEKDKPKDDESDS